MTADSLPASFVADPPPAAASPLPASFVPDAAPDFKATNETDDTGHSVIDFGAHFLSQVDPRPLGTALRHPLDTLKAIGAAQGKVGLEAKDAFDKGDYIGAAAHALYYLIPLVGPALDHAGNELRAGRTAAGLGDTLGLASALFGSAKAPDIVRAMPTSGPQLVKGAITAGKLIKSPVRTLVGMAADELQSRLAPAADAAPALDPRTAPLPPTGKAPALNDVLIDALNAARDKPTAATPAPTEYPQAANDTMRLLAESRARFEAAKAARQAPATPAPPQAQAAPVASAPPAAQPPAAASVAAATPPVPAPAAISPAAATNALGLAASRAKAALTLQEIQGLVPLVQQGASPADAVAAYVQQRADPSAALATALGTPGDADVAAAVAARNADGQWHAPSADLKARRQAFSDARLDELRKKFGGTGR